MYVVPVRPMEMLRVSYAVGSGLALARVGLSRPTKRQAAARRRVIDSLQSVRGTAGD
jgi:hypothetical protein